jgi:hypothetical protein
VGQWGHGETTLTLEHVLVLKRLSMTYTEPGIPWLISQQTIFDVNLRKSRVLEGEGGNGSAKRRVTTAQLEKLTFENLGVFFKHVLYFDSSR